MDACCERNAPISMQTTVKYTNCNLLQTTLTNIDFQKNGCLLLKECFHLYADNGTIHKLKSSAHNLNNNIQNIKLVRHNLQVVYHCHI